MKQRKLEQAEGDAYDDQYRLSEQIAQMMKEFALQSQSSKGSFIRNHDLESNPPTERQAHEPLAPEAAYAVNRGPPPLVYGGTLTRSGTRTVGSQRKVQKKTGSMRIDQDVSEIPLETNPSDGQPKSTISREEYNRMMDEQN